MLQEPAPECASSGSSVEVWLERELSFAEQLRVESLSPTLLDPDGDSSDDTALE